MPEHVLMSEIEIITDGGRRRRKFAPSPLRPSGWAQQWTDRAFPRSLRHPPQLAAKQELRSALTRNVATTMGEFGSRFPIMPGTSPRAEAKAASRLFDRELDCVFAV